MVRRRHSSACSAPSSASLNAFQAIATQKTSGIGAVAGGISEALVTTAFGLLVAIPAVMTFNYFTNKVEAFDVEMDNSSSELVDYFIKQSHRVSSIACRSSAREYICEITESGSGGRQRSGRRQRIPAARRIAEAAGCRNDRTGKQLMAIKKREEGKKVNSNINVTPMVDVMLVLLIIFMVITPMLNNKVNVTLPVATQRRSWTTPTRKTPLRSRSLATAGHIPGRRSSGTERSGPEGGRSRGEEDGSVGDKSFTCAPMCARTTARSWTVDRCPRTGGVSQLGLLTENAGTVVAAGSEPGSLAAGLRRQSKEISNGNEWSVVQAELSSDINVTPLIDVLLVLLIIFMVIVPVTPEGLETLVPQPPKNPQQDQPNDRTIVVQVISQGAALPQYKINDQTFARADIAPELAEDLCDAAGEGDVREGR